MRPLLLTLLFTALALPATAQDAAPRPDPQNPEGENLATPPTWTVRLDSPKEGVVIGSDKETADIWFVNMTPGWHVTTGPAAIFYHPASTAEGTYRAEALLHLFDPKGRNEAFGLFMGGQNLDGDDVTYDYFVLRNTGEFLIKRRTGGDTSIVKGWTKHDAIATYGPDAEGSVPNTLAVEVGADDVAFFVNDAEVARLPKAEVQTDGVVGLRINHALNLHVEDLSVTPLDS